MAYDCEEPRSHEKPILPETVKVEFEKIGQRILALPIPARNYTEIVSGKEGVLFVVEGPLVEPLSGPSALTAHRFELKTRKIDNLLDNILEFHGSANGATVPYRQPT